MKRLEVGAAGGDLIACGATETEERFFCKTEALAFAMREHPGTFELSSPNGQGDKTAGIKFALGDPQGENSHPEAKLHKFLDRLHVPGFDDCVQSHLFLFEIILNEAEGIAVFLIENVVLTWNLITKYFSGHAPGMIGINDKGQLIIEHGVKFELIVVSRLEDDGLIDFVGMNGFD